MTNQAHSSSDLKKSGEIAEETYGNIETLQKRLYGEIQALMTGWKGDAARQFYSSFQAFDAEFGQVQKSLEVFHGKLVDTNIKYDRNEAEQSSTAASIKQLLNG